MGVTAFLPISRSKCKNEFRAASLVWLHPGPSAMPLGDLSYDGESGAGALDLPSDRPLEQLENAFRMLRRHSRPTVSDDEANLRTLRSIWVIGCNLDVGCFFGARELQRIRQEVVHPLGRPGAVGPEPRKGLRDPHRRAGFLDLVFELTQRLTHDALALDLLGWKIHPLRARKRQNIRHQSVHSLSPADDTPEKILAFLVESLGIALLHHAREVLDGTERLS